VSLLEYDAKKARALAAGEYDGGEELMLGDVSAMLLDYEESDYSSSPTSSSASSDTESVHSAGEEIEVSPLHRASVHVPTMLTLTLPEPAHMRPVSVRDAGDIV
jgi:hypothetical protein